VSRKILMMAAVATALTPVAVSAAEATTERQNNTYFSRSEVSKYFKQAQEAKAAAPKESHLRSDTEEGPVVDLAPMTVKTDDSPLLQEVRKRIEMGPESIRNRLAELSPMLAQDAAYDARAADRFFTEDADIGPSDSGTPARIDFVPILKSAGKAIKEAEN
jgi:hypothetical protein